MSEKILPSFTSHFHLFVLSPLLITFVCSFYTTNKDEQLKNVVARTAGTPDRVVLKIGTTPGVVVNWIDVSKSLRSKGVDKTSAQCLRRYKKIARNPLKFGPVNVIAVQVNGKWTDEEDAKLTDLVHKFDYKWSEISAELQGEERRNCTIFHSMLC